MDTLAVIRERYAADIATWAGRAGFGDPRVALAFGKVPREHCLTPPPWRIFAPGGLFHETTADPAKLYDDVLVVLDPKRGINNGQPSLHAAWMMAVSPQPGERVVQIGAGSGYYTAILAELVGECGRVEAYEIVPHLAALAAANLKPWPWIEVRDTTGTDAIPSADVVYVAAAAAVPPASWLRALAPGGRLVFPWQSPGGGRTLVVRRTPGGFAADALFGVSFIPCIGAAPDQLPRRGAGSGGSDIRSIWLRSEHEPDDSAIAVHDEVWLSSAPIERDLRTSRPPGRHAAR